MNKQAYISCFIHQCIRNNVNPGALMKSASWFNNTKSEFDSSVWKDYFGRTVYKGRWFPFLFPRERRMSVNPGDTYESLSQLTNIPLQKLTALNRGKELEAGGTVRLTDAI